MWRVVITDDLFLHILGFLDRSRERQSIVKIGRNPEQLRKKWCQQQPLTPIRTTIGDAKVSMYGNMIHSFNDRPAVIKNSGWRFW
jgi:hypothetical protein